LVPVGSILKHGIPPPVDIYATFRILECKEYQNQRYHSTTIHCGTGNVVELRPPCEVPLADDVLKYEAYYKPGRVVDARGRRDVANAVKKDGGTNEFNPRTWVSPLPQPKWYW